MTLDKLESRLTLKVKKVRLSDDDLKAIVKRVNSSRSIQWWKDDIKQLLYEVKCLKDENEAVAALTAERDALREALKNMLYIFDNGYDKADSLGRMRCDEARYILSKVEGRVLGK